MQYYCGSKYFEQGYLVHGFFFFGDPGIFTEIPAHPTLFSPAGDFLDPALGSVGWLWSCAFHRYLGEVYSIPHVRERVDLSSLGKFQKMSKNGALLKLATAQIPA